MLRVFAATLLMGRAAWPWWSRCWRGRPDWGAGLWPAGGILVYLLAAQLFWRTGWMELKFVWMLLLMVSLGIIGHWVLPSMPCSPSRKKLMRKEAVRAFWIYAVLFGYWTLIRGADPGAQHTEQPMDVMWMRSAMVADTPPVRDAWFDNAPATYYADGHQALAFLAIKTGMPPLLAVNTGQIIWFALTGLLAFQAGATLCPGKARTRYRSGWLAIGFLLFVSTPQGAFDAFFREGHFWWWSASRVLQDSTSELITEFPFFSFYLGDNHAHLLGVPILLLGLLSAAQLIRTTCWKWPLLVPMMLSIVWSWRMNPWQTPTALALLGLVFISRHRKPGIEELKALYPALLTAVLLMWPARAPGPGMSVAWNTHGHTTLMELLQVFGFLIPGLCWGFQRGRYRSFRAWLFLLVAGMVLTVEVIYLEDLFQNRMNIVFKVYYQVWILVAVLGAVGWAQGCARPLRVSLVFQTLLCICLIPGTTYALRLTGEALRTSSRSLDAGTAEDGRTRLTLEIADALIQPGERVIEAPGKSYHPETSQLATWTAGHTPIGWAGHQRQWRPGVPHPDPLILYRAQTEMELEALLLLWRPDWLVWGREEQEHVTPHPEWETWMDARADRVINDPGRVIFRMRAGE